MRGIDKFKERFAGHDGEYVLIGGGACDLLLFSGSWQCDAQGPPVSGGPCRVGLANV